MKHTEAQLQAISFACQVTVILLPRRRPRSSRFGYQIKGNKCFVLGDPVGNPKMMRAATNQFMKQADCLGYQLAFYKISESYVVMLHELGFHFTKVGEAGIVDLATEDLSRLSQQLEYQRLMKEGYHFTWYDQLPEELHQAVNEVSQKWLQGAREKYFSVGRFDKSYVLSSGVGIVRKDQKSLASSPLSR